MAAKKTIGAVIGASLLAGSTIFGINHSTAPAPIYVAHGICENGKTVSTATYHGKKYPKGTVCKPIVTVKRKG